MPKAIDIARDLQTLVDNLSSNPDFELPSVSVFFSGFYGDTAKQEFINVAKIMPRPIRKEYSDYDLTLKYRTDNMYLSANVARDKVCEIIAPAQPAKFRCESLLNEAEDAELITE